MASTMINEFDTFFGTEAAPAIDSFEYKLLDGFGIMDSHQYRQKYLNLTQKEGFGLKEHIWLYILVNQVKSLERLKDSRGMGKPEFKQKYGKEDWYNRIESFLKKHCVMYVAETRPGRGEENKFPIVNINTAWPTMAFIAFCYRLYGSKNVSVLTDNEILDSLLEDKNTWVVQMYNNDSLQDLARVANQKFWTQTVTKSKNPVAGAYEGQAGSTEGKWNQSYYQTQSEDQYPYATMQAGRLKVIPGMKSPEQVIEIIRTFK